MQLFYRWGGFQLGSTQLQCYDGATPFGITIFNITTLNVAVIKVSLSLYVVSVCWLSLYWSCNAEYHYAECWNTEWYYECLKGKSYYIDCLPYRNINIFYQFTTQKDIMLLLISIINTNYTSKSQMFVKFK